MEEKLNKILEELTCEEKDLLYRKLWYNYVLQDAQDVIENYLDIDVEKSNEMAKEVARKYVYEAEYDCNLSYWTNIEELIKLIK